MRIFGKIKTKETLIYNCIICSKNIIDGTEASIPCNKCYDLCHQLCVDMDNFELCDLCM